MARVEVDFGFVRGVTIRTMYTFECEYCGQEIEDLFETPVGLTLQVPKLPEGWTVVKGGLVCSNHCITVGSGDDAIC